MVKENDLPLGLFVRMRQSTNFEMAVLLAVRGVAMGGRFVFILFAASYMLADDFGRFGLLAGISQVLPIVIGFEAHQILVRKIRQSPDQAPDTRGYYTSFVLVGSLVTATSGAILLTALGWPIDQITIGVLILLAEHIGLEVFRNLINEAKPTLSVVSLALRTGLWSLAVPFAFFLGLLQTPWNFETVLLFWLSGSIAGILVAYPIAGLFRPRAHDFRFGIWLGKSAELLRQSWLWMVYNVSWRTIDLGGRFILAWMVSEAISGRYTFLSMLASLCYVIQKGVVEPIYYPKLISSTFSEIDYRKFKRSTLLAIVLGFVLSTCGLSINAWFAGPNISTDELISFGLLCGAFAFLALSQSSHFQMYRLHQDFAIMRTGLIGGISTLLISLVATYIFGLVGASAGTFVGALTLLVLKQRVARRLSRDTQHG